jgi:hypothetical protein
MYTFEPALAGSSECSDQFTKKRKIGINLVLEEK